MSSPMRWTYIQKTTTKKHIFFFSFCQVNTFATGTDDVWICCFTLACPCLPVLEVDMSTILHGRPLSMTWPFFLRAEACMGNVADAPDSPDWKLSSAMLTLRCENRMGDLFQDMSNQNQKHEATQLPSWFERNTFENTGKLILKFLYMQWKLRFLGWIHPGDRKTQTCNISIYDPFHRPKNVNKIILENKHTISCS